MIDGHPNLCAYIQNYGLLQENKIIIQHSFDGLGDLLTLSTIPELFSRMGKPVYVSSYQNFRNEGVRDLILSNPYIQGIIDEPGNLDPDLIFWFNKPTDDRISYISKIEHSIFGEMFNKYPKIYYQPRFLPEWATKTFIDLNSVTHSYLHPKDHYLHYAKYYNTNCVTVDDYKTRDIFEYIDIMNSCQRFICTFSGSSILASALNRKNVDCLVTSPFMNDVIMGNIRHCRYEHYFPNINYIVIDSPDNNITVEN